MKLVKLLRPIGLSAICIMAVLRHTDAAAAPGSNLRETFGESPSLPGADLGGPPATAI